MVEEVCFKEGIPKQRQVCQAVLRYCSHKDSDVIEAIPALDQNNWQALRKEILHLYDAEFREEHWQEDNLQGYSIKKRNSKIGLLTSYKKFRSGYTRRSGRMRRNGIISDRDFL